MARLLLERSSARLDEDRRIRFTAGERRGPTSLLDHGGHDPALGARPARAALQRLVEAPLAEAILAGRFGPGDLVRVRAEGDALRFQR